MYLPQQHTCWARRAKTNKRRVFTSSILVLQAPQCESSPGCRVAGQMPPASPLSAERLSTRTLSPQRGKPVLLFPMAVAALGGPLDPGGGPTTGTLPASQWVRGQGEVVLASDPKFHRVYFLKVESEEEEWVSQWRLWKCETIPHSPFFLFFIFISPAVHFLPKMTPTLSVAVRILEKKVGVNLQIHVECQSDMITASCRRTVASFFWWKFPIF